MVELSKERIEKIMCEETATTEELPMILRSIYTRYMRLIEKYMADIDALNDDEIAKLRAYHEETQSLVKYYYLDIPYDICLGIEEFEDEYCNKLLGAGWHEYIFGKYKDFKDENKYEKKSKEDLKAEFKGQVLKGFYSVMGYIFRGGFGTASLTDSKTVNELAGLFFGKY